MGEGRFLFGSSTILVIPRRTHYSISLVFEKNEFFFWIWVSSARVISILRNNNHYSRLFSILYFFIEISAVPGTLMMCARYLWCFHILWFTIIEKIKNLIMTKLFLKRPIIWIRAVCENACLSLTLAVLTQSLKSLEKSGWKLK